MTDIVDVARRVQYTGNGTAGPFSFSFQVNANTEIKVYVGSTLKTITTHYTVSLTSSGAGSISFTSGNHPTSSQTITIVSAVGLARSSVYTTGGPLTATALEADFDTNIMILQQSSQKVDRALAAPEYDATSIDMTLPTKDDRKGKYLAFNSTSGNPEVGPSTTDVTTLASVTSDIATLADLQDGTTATNALSTLAGLSSQITTLGGISSDITSVSSISSNVTTVAGKASLITSQFASDMSLVTADFVADVNTLATSDIVSDLNTLATSDIVTDMNLLATSSNVTAMANLGVSSVITNMANLNASGVITNIGTVAGSISNVNTVAAADSNISALNASGVISNIATVAGATSNISTVATNISGVNSFAERYRIASSAPSSSLDEGDLYFDTSTGNKKLYVYDGSNWKSTAEAAQRTVTTHNVTSAGTQTISVSYTVGLVDVYLNGLKLNISEGDATASNGSSVVVASASVGDIIEVVALSAFNSANYGTAASKNVGIGNDNVPVFTSSVSDNDFLKVSSTSIEGRSASEVLSDIGGQASLTFGIANTNAVKIDHASVASADYAKFTSNGLEGKSFAEVRSDLNVADGANAYVHPNHSGEVTSTADGATEIANNVVDEANLKVSNSPVNGYFLSAQSGNTGGLTWAEVSAGGSRELVYETTLNDTAEAEYDLGGSFGYLWEIFIDLQSAYTSGGSQAKIRYAESGQSYTAFNTTYGNHSINYNSTTVANQSGQVNDPPIVNPNMPQYNLSSDAALFSHLLLYQSRRGVSGSTYRYPHLIGRSFIGGDPNTYLTNHMPQTTNQLRYIKFVANTDNLYGNIRVFRIKLGL